MVEAAPLYHLHGGKYAHRLAGILTSALSPTNTLLGNPAALKHAVATRGLSLFRGARNLASDLVRNQGMPSQIKRGTFRVAENVAATPGPVVYRNDMVELLQHQPERRKSDGYRH